MKTVGSNGWQDLFRLCPHSGPPLRCLGNLGLQTSANLRTFCCGHLNNRIAAILLPMRRGPSAGTGLTVSTGGSLNGPLGLTVAPNGHILVVNGNDGFITEITPRGKQLAKVFLDNTGTPPRSGTLFGVTFDPQHGALFVDDGSNTLNSLN